MKFNKYIFNLTFLAVLLPLLSQLPAQAARFRRLECVQGNCDTRLRVRKKDLTKKYPGDNTRVLMNVDTRKLNIGENDSINYKVIVYEDNAGIQDILTVSYVRLPLLKSNIVKQRFFIELPAFIGTKNLRVALHNSSGKLEAIYGMNVTTRGTIETSNNIDTNSFLNTTDNNNFSVAGFDCESGKLDECVTDAIFFKKAVFETNNRRFANETNIVKESDGTYRVRIPVKPASIRILKDRPNRKFVTLNDGSAPPDLGNQDDLDAFSLVTNELTIGLGAENSKLAFNPETDTFTISVNGSPAILTIDGAGNVLLGSGSVNPNAKLSLSPTAGQVPIILNNSNLDTTVPANGSFEFTGSGLYFTVNGERKFIVLNPTSSTLTSTVIPNVNVTGSNNTNNLGGNPASFYQNADNINAGVFDAARLPADIGAIRLNNESDQNFMVFKGAANVTLENTADSNLELPTTGTLITLDEISLASNSVTSAEIIDGEVKSIDIKDGTLDNRVFNADLDASKINENSQFINIDRLPSRTIVDITGLAAALDAIVPVTDTIDALDQTDTDKPLSAQQGFKLQQLINDPSSLLYSTKTVGPLTTNVTISFTENQSFYTVDLANAESLQVADLEQGHIAYVKVEATSADVDLPANIRVLSGNLSSGNINWIHLEVVKAGNNPMIHAKIFN
jgi:hypothetical protein